MRLIPWTLQSGSEQVPYSVCGIRETWRYRDRDIVMIYGNIGKWRHGDLETRTWRHRHGDMDIETWT